MSEQMKTDWREMSAGRELDRVVAERLGWTDIAPRYDRFDEHEISPLQGIPPSGGTTYYVIGRYSTDADAALALLEGCFYTLRGTPDSYEGEMLYRCSIDGKAGDGVILPSIKYTVAKTPALAIVRAWLSWKDAQ